LGGRFFKKKGAVIILGDVEPDWEAGLYNLLSKS